MTNTILVTSERLAVQRLTYQDTDFIEIIVNEPAFKKYIGDKGVTSKSTAINYLDEGPLASYTQHGFGLYKVTRISDGAPIGLCGLLKRDIFDYPDVGFAFLTEFNGRGYGFEAASMVIEYETKQHSIDTICAVAALNNVPSMALLAKLGFELLTGSSRADCGEFDPANYYELRR